jgi:hypothetical protein
VTKFNTLKFWNDSHSASGEANCDDETIKAVLYRDVVDLQF